MTRVVHMTKPILELTTKHSPAPPEMSLGLDPSAAPTFPLGYQHLHDDVSLNFQLNRWFMWAGPSAITDLRTVAPRIHNYDDWKREFLRLAGEALAAGRTLPGAIYLRAAEFYMLSSDPNKRPSRQRFVGLMRRVYRVEASHRYTVPYETGFLPVYRVTGGTKGTIVLFGGFDSYIENFFPIMLYLARAGYDVVGFEGPGQGGALEDYGLKMTPAWERPVAAVLDYFDLDDVTLLGMSLGGCLAIRAAAFEPRIHRVVAFDVLFDFLEAHLSKTPPFARGLVRLLLSLRANFLLDRLVGFGMRRSLLLHWVIEQGEHVFGVDTPSGYFAAARQYNTALVSKAVTCDVLLLAGSEDHYVPLTQFHKQAAALRNAASLTCRMFTRADHAQNHCQYGNVGLALDLILSWLNQISLRPPESC